jgi:hypothetical protein
MSKLAEHIRGLTSRRVPPYRPALLLDEAGRTELAAKLGSADNYDLIQLREMVQTDPDNIEFRKALVSAIASAEYAGVDAFSRKVCEWQDWDVPWSLIMAIARQTWDEVRHAQLATGVLESYGGTIGEYPDTLAGGAPPPSVSGNGSVGPPAGIMNDPVITLSAINVSLEGGALRLFEETSKLGERVGDPLLQRCYDYNWADEVTHAMIGDYFVRALASEDPDAEHRALRAHAMFEYSRVRLGEEQTEELKEFFAEEMQRAQTALGGQTSGYQ